MQAAESQVQVLGLLVIDLEQMAEAYTELTERAELVRSVALGEPASSVHTRQRRRRMTSP